MSICSISIWGNPVGRGYIVNRVSDLMTASDCEQRNIDGDSVFSGEYYSVMYTDRGYIISCHYILENEGMVASEFGGVINFRDPRTVISVAIPRSMAIKDPVRFFAMLRAKYREEIGKLITIDELSSRVARALPIWESEAEQYIEVGKSAYQIYTQDARGKAVVYYNDESAANVYLSTVERLAYKGNKVIYFAPVFNSNSFATLTPILGITQEFIPAYTVNFPDGTSKVINSLDEPIDHTVCRPFHDDLVLQGTINSKMVDWCVVPSEDCSEYTIKKEPTPKRKVYQIDCYDSGTGLYINNFSTVTITTKIGRIEGNALVLLGEDIATVEKNGVTLSVGAPYRCVKQEIMQSAEGNPCIKMVVVQVVAFNVDEYIRQVQMKYNFAPEIYINGQRHYSGSLNIDIDKAQRCVVTIKGSVDYEPCEFKMPLDSLVIVPMLEKIVGKKITFEVKGEALMALEKGLKITFRSEASSASDRGDAKKTGKNDPKKGGKKDDKKNVRKDVQPRRPEHSFRVDLFNLSKGHLSHEFDHSFLSAEREYEVTLDGFKPLVYKLPKHVPSTPVALHFKPTAGTVMKNNKGWVFSIVLAFLLGAGLGFGTKVLIDYLNDKREEDQERKATLASLSEHTDKLMKTDFTAKDIKALEALLEEHKETLSDEQEYKDAEEQVKVATAIMGLCTGNDDVETLLKDKGLSKPQITKINEIAAMPELAQVDQNSASLDELKKDLQAVKEKNENATAEEKQKRADFDKKCENLNNLSCTIAQLNDLISYAENNKFTAEANYQKAVKLRNCIYTMTSRTTKGANGAMANQMLIDNLRGYVKNNQLPATALKFIQKVLANNAACVALPLDNTNLNDLQSIKTELERNVVGDSL